ncbi:hypothetical protein BY458DRAFT_514686 [Sporodiniella umbellata]|nr:hypothetical protein BY458DRAFT_514686 [Sporodiniella umbellata]
MTTITEKRRIALAYEGTEEAHKLFDWTVKNILRPETDHLILLSAIQRTNYKVQRRPSETGEVDPAERRLKELMTQLTTAHISSEEHILWGDARTQLPNYTKSHPVDILIMGSRGLSTVKSVLLGSVSETCLKECPCPVLVVRNTFI